MNPYEEERKDNTPPPVPEDYRRENPYERVNPYRLPDPPGWDNRPQEQPSGPNPKPFNPYKVGLESQPSPRPANPYPPQSNPDPNPYNAPGYQEYDWQRQTQQRPAQQQRASLQRLGGYRPFWTYTLLVAIGAMFIAQIAREGSMQNAFSFAGGFSVQNLIDMGGLQPQLVREGEWWRLITVMFLHGSLIHILFNGLALWSFGVQLESQVGSTRFLMIYFLGGLCGSILSFGLGNYPVAVGASGALFALLGGLIGFLARHRNVFGRLGRAQLNSLIFTAVLNFVILLNIPQVDNLAHLGGLLGGTFLGYFLPSDYDTRQANQDTTGKILGWWPVLLLVAVEVGMFVYFIGNPPVVTGPRLPF